MTIHTKWLVILLSGILLFGGCRRRSMPGGDHPGAEAADTALVDISLLLRYSNMKTKSEPDPANVETRISNLNLFFVHDRYPTPGTPEVRHYYFDLTDRDLSAGLKLSNIRLGNYTLYAIANSRDDICGTDHSGSSSVSDNLCTLTRAEIEALTVRAKNESGTSLLLMTAQQPIQIKKHFQTFPLELTRRHSKIDFNYTVTEKGQTIGLKFNTIQLKNMASNLYPFASGQLPTLFSLRGFSPIEPLQGTITCYPMENRQGEGTNYTGGAKERTAQHAPANATYFYLGGTYRSNSMDKQVGFSIYLGEELDGNNFDVTSNRHYQIDARFNGLDPADNRISWISIDPGTNFMPTYIDVGMPTEAKDILIECNNCFNDQLYLFPQTLGAVGSGTYRVFITGNDGIEREISPGSGGRYLVLEPGTTGNGQIRCRVTYIHDTRETVKLTLTLKNNLGEMDIFTQPSSIIVD